MKYILFSFLILFSARSMPAEYKVEVIYPDKEVVVFSVGNQGKEIPLRSNQWRCYIDQVGREFTKGVESSGRVIYCKGPENTTTETAILCPDTVVLTVGDGKISYTILVSCEGSQPVSSTAIRLTI